MSKDSSHSGLSRNQWIVLAAFTLIAIISCFGAEYTGDLILQHIPTTAFVIILPIAARWIPISGTSFGFMVGFMSLHIIGARYVYSFVPYNEWFQTLMGINVNEIFAFERNHYDRFVHFCYGLMITIPALEFIRRIIRPRGGWCYFLAFEFIVATSLFYEFTEWLIAMIFAPDWADAYLGQQGDIWDAHRDMALATFGSLVAVLLILIFTYRHILLSRLTSK